MLDEAKADLSAIQTIMAATRFAAEKHARQRRKGEDAEPYVNHVIEVAELVSTVLVEPDVNVIVAALLHDTIEDTATTREELVEHFGSDVAALVVELTDDKSLPKADRKRLQVEHAPHKSFRAQMIKLADKISNLRSILVSPPASWDYERRREYVAWAERVVAGLTSPNPLLLAEFRSTVSKFRNGS